MRLSKPICKRCMEETATNGWMPQDESRWREGEVWCAATLRANRTKLRCKEPPEWCPYAAEQVLSQ